VNDLANSGAPDKALPIVDSLLKDNPADPQMLRTKWLLQLKAGQFKNAIATGEDLAKADTSIVSVDFYNRMIGAAQSDSNPAKVQELTAKASQKFPKEVSFPLLLAQSYIKGGQTQMAEQYARKATVIDPKNANAWLFAVVSATQLNQADSAMAFAKQAIANGADKDAIGQAMLQNVNAAFQKAQASKTRDDYLAALSVAQAVDSIAPSAQTKFFIGVESYSIAADILTHVQTLAKSQKKDDRAQACTEAKQAEDYLALTSIAMPAGASVDKNTAGQILGAVGQYSEFVTSVKKAFCK
jgi:tetratricopeptide (TPR) repeat protein